MAEYVVSNPMAEIREQSDARDPAHLGHSSGYWSSPEQGVRVKGASLAPSLTASPQRPLTSDSGLGASAAPGASPAQGQIRYEHTGEIESPIIRRRPRPLRKAVLQTRRLDPNVRKHLLDADECLYQRKNSEAIPHLEAGLLGCGQYPELQSLIWMLLGTAHVTVGHFKEASVCHLHHLAFCRELEDFANLTKAECNLGIAYTKLGLLKLAGRCFLQYLENSQQLQDQASVANALSNLGLLSKTLALHAYHAAMRDKQKAQAKETLHVHLRRAITYLEQHLEIVEELGDLEKQARAYGNLGWCYQTMQQYPQAIFCHNKRLEVARTTGDRKTECCTLCNLGNCFRATGKLQEAADYYLLNLELSRATGNMKNEIVSLLNLGVTCELLDQLDKAIEWHTLYLGAMVDKGDVHGQARAFSTLAGIYEETQQMTKAEEYYKKLARVFHQLGDRESQSIATSFVRRMKVRVQQEKQLSMQESKKTLKRYRKSPRRRNIRTVSKANTFRLEPPKRRSTMTSNKMGTWGQTRLPWYCTPPVSPCPPAEGEEAEGEVLGNPGAEGIQQLSQEFLTLANQPRQYSTQRVTRDLLEQERVMVGTTPHPQHSSPFYKLGRIITKEERPLPETPPVSDTGSVTSFESVQDCPRFHRTIAGSRRHITELQRVGADLSQPVSELGLFGTDKEWEQWLRIQETTDDTVLSQVGSLNIDMSVFSRERGSASSVLEARPHHSSAPHIADQPNSQSQFEAETTVEMHNQ